MAMLGILFLSTWILWDQAMLLRCDPVIQVPHGWQERCEGTMPMPENKYWHYLNTFDSREICQDARELAEVQHPTDVLSVSGDLLLKQTHRYVCLPAGVHPKDTQ
jgi:hypothetical protein